MDHGRRCLEAARAAGALASSTGAVRRGGNCMSPGLFSRRHGREIMYRVWSVGLRTSPPVSGLRAGRALALYTYLHGRPRVGGLRVRGIRVGFGSATGVWLTCRPGADPGYAAHRVGLLGVFWFLFETVLKYWLELECFGVG